MKSLLKLEELGSLLLGVYLFTTLDLSWWWFFGLFLLPDISMLGYLFGPKVGAWSYNLFHLKILGVALFFIGYHTPNVFIQLAGVVIFSHAAFDRIMGYGLKYETGFKDTHLGKIGK